MKIILLFICCFISSLLFSQTTKDTTFSIRGNTCQCKLVTEGTADVKPFDLNEKPAYYPGGEDEWKKFVKKNIDKKLKGKDVVEVHVEINEKGELSGFRLLSRAANQKYEEAVYILKLSGKWFPAIQNGYCVKSVKRLVFEF
jgi:hypothetical protein